MEKTTRPFKQARQRALNLMMLPFLFGSILLVLLPALVTFFLSFTKYNAVAPPEFVGIDNYKKLFTTSLSILTFQNTLIYLGLAVPIRLVAAFSLALLLQKKGRLFGWVRAAVYTPTIIPGAAYALIWLWLFNPVYGSVSWMLEAVGLPSPAWLISEGSARIAIVILVSFQMGEGFIVLLAGLQNIGRHTYEAARVDGANQWQQFLYITLPLMAPWLLLLTFRDLLVTLQASFTPTFILTYGGPYYATTFVPLLIYEFAFDFFDFGTAAALLTVTLALMGILILGVVNLVEIQSER